ncbi:unnamed protein product [Dibothriocephalus latus]|uniref:Extracellular Endonuclease subunit A domain-containing protein n=1 Tax=Dibothriocephalus latus TaxID=60516 RepID=A0A3P7LBM0_DIBLA|nr:unnamed protein product [Dibothriocephalus latus]
MQLGSSISVHIKESDSDPEKEEDEVSPEVDDDVVEADRGRIPGEGGPKCHDFVNIPFTFSLATGRNVETHGLVGNTFHDKALNDSYVYKDSEKNMQPQWFTQNGNEPILLTNQRHGGKTGMIYWPGSEARYNDTIQYVSFGLYSNAPTLRFRVDRIMEWITQPDVNFCMLYFNQPDSAGHKYEPDSKEVLDAIELTNDGIAYLLQRIEQADFQGEKPNVIVTSDHGMNAVSYKRVVNQLLKRSTKDLKATSHKKEKIPESYHYKNNPRIAPIVVIADLGWMIQTIPYTNTLNGMYGYNHLESDMHPFIVTAGPDIRQIGLVDRFYQVDVYPLVCMLRGLDKPNKIDGEARWVATFLKQLPSLADIERFDRCAKGLDPNATNMGKRGNEMTPLCLALLALLHHIFQHM